MKKIMFSIVGLSTLAIPVISISCSNKVNTGADKVNTGTDQNSNSSELTFSIPHNVRVGFDNLVEDTNNRVSEMDAIFPAPRVGVAAGLGYPSGTSIWTIMCDRASLKGDAADYEKVKGRIIEVLKQPDQRAALKDLITSYDLPIDPISFKAGGKFGDISELARSLLLPNNNLYPVMVYGFGYIFGLNSPLSPSDLVIGKEFTSPNPFINLRANVVLPPVANNESVKWTVLDVQVPDEDKNNGAVKMKMQVMNGLNVVSEKIVNVNGFCGNSYMPN